MSSVNRTAEKDPLISKGCESKAMRTESRDSDVGWWGWVVVMSSFYCIAVLDGVGYTTGVMLDSLLQARMFNIGCQIADSTGLRDF